MDRRDFIKKSCLTCMALGAAVTLPTLESCTTLSVIKAYEEDGKIRVALQSFPVDKNVLLLRTSKLEYDILLVKKADNTFHALYMQCTHNSNPLSPTGSRIYCSSHGAEFDLEGNVKAGPPKTRLHSFPVAVKDDKIEILVNGVV